MPGKATIVSCPSQSLICGEKITGSVTVRNDGDDTLVFHVSIIDGSGNTIWSSYTYSIDPGEERTISIGSLGYGEARATCSAPIVLKVYNEGTKTFDDECTIASSVSGNCTYSLRIDVNTEKTNYSPEEQVNVTVIVNSTDCCTEGTIKIIDQGGNEVASASTPGPVCPNDNLNMPMSLTAPSSDGTYTYTVKAITEKGDVTDEKTFQITVGSPSSPFFVITDIQYNDRTVCGETETITLTIKNTGQTAGQATVKLLSGGEEISSATTSSIDPGQSVQASVEYNVPGIDGTLYLTVQVLDSNGNKTDEENIEVIVDCKEAKPYIKDIRIPQLCAGSDATITIEIANDGEKDKQYGIKMRLGGKEIHSSEGVVPAKSTVTIDVNMHTPSTEGDYPLEIILLDEYGNTLEDITTIVTVSSCKPKIVVKKETSPLPIIVALAIGLLLAR